MMSETFLCVGKWRTANNFCDIWRMLHQDETAILNIRLGEAAFLWVSVDLVLSELLVDLPQSHQVRLQSFCVGHDIVHIGSRKLPHVLKHKVHRSL